MAASYAHHLQLHRHPFSLPSELRHHRLPCLTLSFGPLLTSRKARVFRSRGRRRRSGSASVCCMCKTISQIENVEVRQEIERPPFDLNLAVILAGFAFEAYYTPPDSVGRHEMDAAGCKTVYLSESFIREIYDGQLFVKLKKGLNLPAMDLWGTSDPYVIMQFGGQVVKSNTKWGSKEPTWNEEFTLSIKQPPKDMLQVAAWDANLLTPHTRMGNAGVNLEGLCDGILHEVLVELEGMGGGGKIQLEIRYKSFEEIDDDKKWWRLPFISDFLRKNGFESAVKKLVGSETVQVRDFVQFAFRQLKSFNDTYFPQDKLPNILKQAILDNKEPNNSPYDLDPPLRPSNDPEGSSEEISSDLGQTEQSHKNSTSTTNGPPTSDAKQDADSTQSNKHFWNNFSDLINQNVVQHLGIPVPEKMGWEGFDLLDKIGLHLKTDAEAGYIESGLAAPASQDDDKEAESGPVNIGIINSSLPDVKKATEDLLRQTDSIFGAMMLLAAAVPQLKKESSDDTTVSTEIDVVSDHMGSESFGGVDEQRDEEMKALFSTAESAMEAWAMLATSLGHPSFIKSEFEKICFLDNSSTDTQVSIWRDPAQKRLVVAFRGTEQTRWKDLMTDLMLAPAGLNPERIGGDFKQEVQVHSGFLSAYDSVRTRIMSLIQQAIDYKDDDAEPQSRWHVYATGHSLGGALATLLALELSSSKMAKHGVISVTMYNFGSPRVGNRQFAEIYNEKVKDSWRVVNHRDIIPTVPRLMGYCHVAHPVYLAPGDQQNSIDNLELSGDGYEADVIGESTPDVIVSEFMKGEKELIEKLLQTEINIFRSIRDGSALMQHMEDFYYIMLLENVRSKYQAYAVTQNQVNGASVG